MKTKKSIAMGVILALMACNLSTADSIKQVLLVRETQRLEAQGEHIETIDIDSIRYTTTSEKTILRVQAINHNLNNLKSANYASTQQEFKQRMQAQQQKDDSMQQAVAQADTTRNIYEVLYRLNARTDKSTYNTQRKVYLKASGLQLYELPDDVKN